MYELLICSTLNHDYLPYASQEAEPKMLSGVTSNHPLYAKHQLLFLAHPFHLATGWQVGCFNPTHAPALLSFQCPLLSYSVLIKMSFQTTMSIPAFVRAQP